MNKVYQIRQLDKKNPTLMIHPNTADALGIRSRKMAVLRFGCIRQFADISLSGDVLESEIWLSSKLTANLHLPDFPDYELRVNENEIEIGPFIGMLMSRKDERLTPSSLEKMKIYLSDYRNLHGAVVVFALDKADAVGRLIEGYCYNPVSRQFEKGVYPFPSSIYRAIGLSDFWKNCFYSVIGDRFFNNQYFNKWEMYQWYSAHPELSSRVPFTCLYKTAQDVFDSLDKYKTVFIKPVAGLGGHGITQVRQSGEKFTLKYRENGKNQSDVLQSKQEAAEYLTAKFSDGRYLIQQSIDLIQIKGHVVDFRCVMQKNQSGKWSCRAIIGRYGDRGSVVSNISSGGKAVSIENLAGSLPLPKSKAHHLSDEIGDFALQICSALDEYGLNCGTLGLDIGADITGNLWLIEINNRDPDPTIALDIHDRLLYIKLKTGILAYAKFLSGFKETP